MEASGKISVQDCKLKDDSKQGQLRRMKRQRARRRGKKLMQKTTAKGKIVGRNPSGPTYQRAKRLVKSKEIDLCVK